VTKHTLPFIVVVHPLLRGRQSRERKKAVTGFVRALDLGSKLNNVRGEISVRARRTQKQAVASLDAGWSAAATALSVLREMQSTTERLLSRVAEVGEH
jgi:hypothetical protein